ncbi:hypothetical protein REPUB_Repub03eG0170900 [Reevesia pubescens]
MPTNGADSVVGLSKLYAKLQAIGRARHMFQFIRPLALPLVQSKIQLLALDIRVKNVAPTYSVEHEGESVLFDQLFALLNSDMQNEESYRRVLASYTGALHTSVTQHMSKEE